MHCDNYCLFNNKATCSTHISVTKNGNSRCAATVKINKHDVVFSFRSNRRSRQMCSYSELCIHSVHDNREQSISKCEQTALAVQAAHILKKHKQQNLHKMYCTSCYFGPFSGCLRCRGFCWCFSFVLVVAATDFDFSRVVLSK